MSAPQTIVEIYSEAKWDAMTRAAYYRAAASKQFEERRFELSDFNIKRAQRWAKAADDFAEAEAALRGNWVPW